jgi:hypothetical protein
MRPIILFPQFATMPAVVRSLFVALLVLLGSADAAVNLSAIDQGGTLPAAGQDLFLTPTITSVRGRVARVQVPPGYEQVSIERRVARKTRPWAPFASHACSPNGGEVTLELPRRLPKRFLRATGRKVAVLPTLPATPPSTVPHSSTVSGWLTTFFAPDDGSIRLGLEDGFFNGSATLDLATTTSLSLNSGTTSSGVAVATAATRAVVESDIWKLHGDRLYVFNAYRGLQALDLANPAEPVLLGTLPFPDAGDALYLLGANHVALLTKREFSFTWNAEPLQRGGALVICDVRDGKPIAVASLPIHGRVLESRLVGTALYIATAADDYGTYHQSIRVTGYDLLDPARPIERNSVLIAKPAQDGYSYLGAVQASDACFMIAENLYVQSSGQCRTRVSLVDISSPTGTVRLRGAVSVAGLVRDKFKMQERAGVLTVISDVQSERHTRLENFNWKLAGTPVRLGSLVLGQNESVRGTRFDGTRVYVVTFLQIDPLWIVDNSKPSAPAIVGHLEVPGFSTYLEPLGDRLVTIGLLDGRVTVSLFDVADPAAPKALSQIPVTDRGAWSEATWNEKAFSVNPNAGLIMVPVDNGWDWNAGWNSSSTSGGGIQLVDLEREHLTARGRINRPFVPRRSAFHRGTIVAIGDSALLTADTTDRDKPAVLAELQLAWRADFVWPVGNYLLQVGAEIGGRNPVVTVTPASNPDATISSIELGNHPVVTADLHDGYLYVVQDTGNSYPQPPSEAAYTLKIFNVSSLPQLIESGNVLLPIARGYGNTMRIVWPQPGTAVVVVQELYPYLTTFRANEALLGGGITTFDTTQTASNAAITTSSLSFTGFNVIYPYHPGGQRKQFIACNVTDPLAPAVLSTTNIVPPQQGSFSEVFAAEGKVFVSYQNGWFYPIYFHFTIFSLFPAPAVPTEAGRHYLHVVDFNSPDAPISRERISAPGVLKGLTRGSTVVYTQGWEYDKTGTGIAGSTALHASVYDGQKLTLAANILLPGGGHGLFVGDQVITFFNQSTSETDGKLASYARLWDLADMQFVARDEIRVSSGWDHRALDGVLFTLSFNGWETAVSALDFSNPHDLRSYGSFGVPGIQTGLRHLTGDRANDFWVPAADFGVLKLTLPSL